MSKSKKYNEVIRWISLAQGTVFMVRYVNILMNFLFLYNAWNCFPISVTTSASGIVLNEEKIICGTLTESHWSFEGTYSCHPQDQKSKTSKEPTEAGKFFNLCILHRLAFI
jgi:hypothetical protein